MLAFLVLFLLPSLCMTMGVSSEFQPATSTQVLPVLPYHGVSTAAACMWMTPLTLPPRTFRIIAYRPMRPAIPPSTNYAMFGGFKAKLNGLHHVYVQYFGKSTTILFRLYEPYNNRECLHCHLGARSFEIGALPHCRSRSASSGEGKQTFHAFPAAATTWFTTSEN